MSQEKLNTHQKALALNLDQKCYGTLAEIGAGQDVANWLFRVGGAAGTVAKTISAYDMKVSDEIYGETSRYVSRERVVGMLAHEYELLQSRLAEERGPKSTFFVFADSVSARNYQGTNVCHGWLGIRFQSRPESDPYDILLHVNMSDSTNLLQQQAIGILGINLIYGVFHHLESLDTFLASLQDDLSLLRIDLDYVEFCGANFADSTGVALGLKLLRSGLTRSILYTSDGKLTTAAGMFYKRALMVVRVPQLDEVGAKAIKEAQVKLLSTSGDDHREPLALVEVVSADNIESPLSLETVQRRVDQARALNCAVLLTALSDHSELTPILQRHTTAPISYLISPASLVRLFNEKNFAHLPGSIAQAMARFISTNVKLYIAAMPHADFHKALAGRERELETWKISASESISLKDLAPTTHLRHLYTYLQELGALVGLDYEQTKQGVANG